jgi:competence protein ComEA
MVGVGCLLYGLWGVIWPEPAVVEIVQSSSIENGGEIVVDVGGEVITPGVYKLPTGARIGDALVLAGGLSAEADRQWVAQMMNLAQEIKDGGKIYIPTMNKTNNQIPITNNQTISNQTKTININTASTAELDTLVGIGEVRAQAIVANRPYGSTEELVSKAKIPEGVYEKIKDQVSVY